ncbi:MAG: hypothetical protein H0X24_00625 [Ktedonobacterales bacterium]|nr:hypothetical protein [Ktedonobacterales bacterium]
MADQEWYTIQELADLLNVSYTKVRNAVATLINIKAVTNRENPQDNRIIQVHKDSLSKVKDAVFGA